MRLETDCIGERELPDEALYGIHSQRAVENFPISSERIHPLLVESLVEIKRAAAVANQQAGTLTVEKRDAIIKACDAVLDGQYRDAFIVPAIQGSAGTSANMNVNEVIAHLAEKLTPAVSIHPNDDVNESQSTNDTFPTSGKMAMLKLLPDLLEAIGQLVQTLLVKANDFEDLIKVGRTQLQDAVPTTFGHSFHAYYSLFKRDLERLRFASEELHSVNMGGTAIGTGVNTTSTYQRQIVPELNELTNLHLTLAPDLIDATQNCDGYVAFSGALKGLAVDLSKMCHDLRLLSSGPQAGFNELKLPREQAGSSIMPGKVNPVIPEVVNQVAFEVIGNDVTVTMAAEAGQLELNAFEPIMFRDILANETHLTNAIGTLIEKCLKGIEVNDQGAAKAVEQSAITATILAPYLGYMQTTALVKEALADHRSVKDLLREKHLLSDQQIDTLFSPASLLHEPVTVANH
ncbi:aspartate ammonia-lyase [Lactiplantibacillus herbarum]|uniref:aspartate ammonia-lyase n=1 Tax=Lactiplantibacillus herbarum TaxID=1670446 RepID=UPI00064FAAA7|nr:aspartate ammonia-lyase [Lactiplantibacillus herbarum]